MELLAPREASPTAGPEPTLAPTLTAAFADTVHRLADVEALRTADGSLSMTWRQYAERACRVAGGLRGLGLERGDRVALMLRNRPEFHVVDTALLLAGGIPFSVYNSSSPDQLRYLLRHAGARMVVVEDDEFLERVRGVRADLPALRHLVSIERLAGATALDELLAADPMDLDTAVASVSPSDAATVIYTSGTTADPKAVVLSHTNLLTGARDYARVLGRSLTGMRTVSALPMAHIAERNATHYYHLTMGTHVTTCPDISALGAVVAEVHPEWLFGTPRLWQKYRTAIQSGADRRPGGREAWEEACSVGRRVRALGQLGEPVGAELAESWQRVRAQVVLPALAPLGLDQLRIANSGAAPMPAGTSAFFLDLGLPLSDVYGQSEAGGTISWDPHEIVSGTSGRPLPGMRVKIAPDGEILLKGPAVFDGYLDDPAATAAAFDRDGWFRTGDVGQFTGHGQLRILDRKKEIIVTSGGKNISPALVESLLGEHPLVGHAVAIGEGRPHLTALIVPDPDALRSWAAGYRLTERAARTDPRLATEIAAAVARANSRLNAAEQVRRHTVLTDTWTPDGELLTPTAKLKRRAILARYAAQIEELYAVHPLPDVPEGRNTADMHG